MIDNFTENEFKKAFEEIKARLTESIKITEEKRKLFFLEDNQEQVKVV